jgi:hypothetical protein
MKIHVHVLFVYVYMFFINKPYRFLNQNPVLKLLYLPLEGLNSNSSNYVQAFLQLENLSLVLDFFFNF